MLSNQPGTWVLAMGWKLHMVQPLVMLLVVISTFYSTVLPYHGNVFYCSYFLWDRKEILKVCSCVLFKEDILVSFQIVQTFFSSTRMHSHSQLLKKGVKSSKLLLVLFYYSENGLLCVYSYLLVTLVERHNILIYRSASWFYTASGQ